MASFRRAPARLLPLALSIAVATTGYLAAPAGAAPAQDDGGGQLPDLTATTNVLHTDLSEMQAAREAAETAYEEAKAKAKQMREKVERNRAAAEAARLVVGQYARTIYMTGPTDISVLASMIDTEQPGDLVRLADEALRVGDHKDDQYDRAVELLRRNEEMQTAAESAEQAAQASLQSIDTQLLGLRREIADGVDAWAKHLAGETTLFSAEQAKLNSEAAAGWARYLGRLADWKVPSISSRDLTKGRLTGGLKQYRNNPGIAFVRKDGEQVVVLPERVVASVTYAVSKLGTPYEWRTNTEKEMDCSALVDRSWSIPMVPRDKRTDERELVPGGAAGIAERTRLVPTDKLNIGDLVFLADKGRGVNHVGIVLRPDLMIASDGTTGGVNAVKIPRNRIWHVGRMSVKAPTKDNTLPSVTKKPFQCGADPRGFVKLPDGKVLSNPDICPPSSAFGEGNMQPAAIRGGRCTAAIWPQIQTIGGWRPSDPYPDHPSGRAIDIMMPAGCSADPANVGIGNSIATFFMQNAGKFDVQYIIWQQRIWTASSGPVPVAQWRGMSNRGGCTANHQDHVHVSFNGPNINPAPPANTDEAADTDSGDGASNAATPGAGSGGSAGGKDAVRGGGSTSPGSRQAQADPASARQPTGGSGDPGGTAAARGSGGSGDKATPNGSS